MFRYRPLFAIFNSMSSLIDLAAQATIGSKSGLSETLDGQLKKILETTATALKEVALDHRKKDDKDATLNDDGKSEHAIKSTSKMHTKMI